MNNKEQLYGKLLEYMLDQDARPIHPPRQSRIDAAMDFLAVEMDDNTHLPQNLR